MIPADKYHSVMKDIKQLHMCTDEVHTRSLKSILSRWNKKNMYDFVAYFRKQWVESKFKNWQIFHTPPGYSHTNSPIESHNNTIKQHFTVDENRLIDIGGSCFNYYCTSTD
jgi:hypothetical protein